MQKTYNGVDKILTFKNKHNFLLFFLNRATGGFGFNIFNIDFLKILFWKWFDMVFWEEK